MFKKDLLKKLAVFAMMGIMTLSLVACGDEKKSGEDKDDVRATVEDTDDDVETEEDTTEEETEEETTEEETTEEETEEETTEDVSSDGLVEGDGVATLNGFSFGVPEGYTTADNPTAGVTSVTYVNDAGTVAFMIAVDNANLASEQTAFDTFDSQIKSVFGEQCTSSDVNYNGYDATEWVTDATDGSYAGRSLVICDGSLLVYIEFVSYDGDVSDWADVTAGISY